MPIKNKELTLSEDFKNVIARTDILILNLEEIITTKKRFLAVSVLNEVENILFKQL